MKKNIPIFVTHYGCPNQCVFCNQKKISGVSRAMDLKACEELLKTASTQGYSPRDTEVAFFGGSFTGIPVSEQKGYLEIARRYRPYFGGIRLSTRPDYITPAGMDLLQEYGVTTVELGVQSMVDEVLLKNRRGMTAEDTKKAVSLIRQYDVSLGLQMMVSMYGSTPEDDLYTADEILLIRPDFVRIYPTVVLEDTELYHLYETGEYRVKSLEETVSLVAQIYEKFHEYHIPVIRMGLMASEDISSRKVIGCYHEAFGELVLGEIYFKKINAYLQGQETIGKRLRIFCPPNRISRVVGHQKRNCNRWKNLYSLKEVKVFGELLEQDEFSFQAELL